MKYKVTKYHHRKVYRRGDLEAETIIDSVETMSTKKAVVQHLENEANSAKRKGYKVNLSTKTRSTMPSLSVYTGVTWVHENTGETENESYWYKVESI